MYFAFEITPGNFSEKFLDLSISGAGNQGGKSFFAALKPLKAAVGTTRTWRPSHGRLTSRWSQQRPLPGRSKAAPGECGDQDGQTGQGMVVCADREPVGRAECSALLTRTTHLSAAYL